MVISSPTPLKSSPIDTAASFPSAALGPSCDLRSRGMGKFPPRLSREPRHQNGPHAHINLPQLPLRSPSNGGACGPMPRFTPGLDAEQQRQDILTLEMRPARLHVSSLWHRLRFSGFSPLASQRRSWKPGRPRRGRPEGTKGAGSRSL